MVAPTHLEIGWTIIAFSVAGLVALGWHHFLGIRGGRMFAFSGMMICGVGFIAFSAWYFWPTEENNVLVSNADKVGKHQHLSANQQRLQINSDESAALSKRHDNIPHISMTLSVDSLEKDFMIFHLNARNLSKSDIYVARVKMKSNKESFSEHESPLKRFIAAGADLMITSAPMEGLGPFGKLTVTVTYGLAPDYVEYSSEYEFFILSNIAAGTQLSPASWNETKTSESSEDDLKNLSAEITSQFYESPRSLVYVLPEKNPDGSPNMAGASVNGKTFIFDPVSGLASFTAKFPGVEKNIVEKLKKSESGNHLIMICWDDTKNTICMSVDSNEIKKQ